MKVCFSFLQICFSLQPGGWVALDLNLAQISNLRIAELCLESWTLWRVGFRTLLQLPAVKDTKCKPFQRQSYNITSFAFFGTKLESEALDLAYFSSTCSMGSVIFTGGSQICLELSIPLQWTQRALPKPIAHLQWKATKRWGSSVSTKGSTSVVLSWRSMNNLAWARPPSCFNVRSLAYQSVFGKGQLGMRDRRLRTCLMR